MSNNLADGVACRYEALESRRRKAIYEDSERLATVVLKTLALVQKLERAILLLRKPHLLFTSPIISQYV